MVRLKRLAGACLYLVSMLGCGGGGGQPSPSPGSPSADFSIAVKPDSLSLPLGTSTQFQVTESPLNGFAGAVFIDAGSLPTGVTISPALPQKIGSSGLSLSVTAAPNATAGTFSLPLVATSGSLQHSTNLGLTLVNPGVGTIPGNRTNWVRLGSNPIAVYYDAPRNHVLASLPAINRIQVIDAGTGSVLSAISASIANFEPNGRWLASASNISSTLDGKSLLALGVGHVSNIDLASGMLTGQQTLPVSILLGRTTPSPIFPTFIVAAGGGHMIFGSWGDSAFYNWDGTSTLASQHLTSDLYSFDRNFDGTKVLVTSGDTSGAYQLLDVASDTITARGAYSSNATIMTVRGNPARNEWAIANSNGVDFFDSNLNLLASVPAVLIGSATYWGMTYSVDGKYLYFVYSPAGLPFVITVDASSHSVVGIAPATGTDLPYYRREPPEWVVQPFAADGTGLVFGLGEKGLVIDDSTYAIDPTQATAADFAIIATPDSGPISVPTPVQITTQTYAAQPDVWFGNQRALAEALNPAGQVSATTPPGLSSGPVNIKLFPPDGYAHVIPQAFTYGTIIEYIRNSVCPVSGGCSADIFGFGLFGSDSSQTSVTIGGAAATVQSVHYLNGERPYPYPLQYVTVTVPPGAAGRAGVKVRSGSGQASSSGGFLYASSLQSYPSSQNYNALLFDEKRGILYASTNSQIARFSPGSSSFLTPITPPSLTGQNQFQGMSLTPDGSRLLVANKQDLSVAVIDPDNPSGAQAVSVPANGPNPSGPVFVAATSTGKALISIGGYVEPWTGPLFELDLSTPKVKSLTFPGVFTGDAPRLSSTGDGSTILIRSYAGTVGIWSASDGQYTSFANGFGGSGLGVSSSDGNIFGVGLGFIAPDATSTIGLGIPDELGGFQSIFPNDAALNDSGSLEFVPSEQTLLILDTHHGDVLRSLHLPNQVNVWTKVIALDSNAEHVFLSDSKGLTVLSLAAAPLAIGSVSPSIASTNGATGVKLRGSGFQPGTVVTVGGKAATSVFIDSNTLQVTTPPQPAGAAPIVVQNPDGESYKLDAAILYQQ